MKLRNGDSAAIDKARTLTLDSKRSYPRRSSSLASAGLALRLEECPRCRPPPVRSIETSTFPSSGRYFRENKGNRPGWYRVLLLGFGRKCISQSGRPRRTSWRLLLELNVRCRHETGNTGVRSRYSHMPIRSPACQSMFVMMVLIPCVVLGTITQSSALAPSSLATSLRALLRCVIQFRRMKMSGLPSISARSFRRASNTGLGTEPYDPDDSAGRLHLCRSPRRGQLTVIEAEICYQRLLFPRHTDTSLTAFVKTPVL